MVYVIIYLMIGFLCGVYSIIKNNECEEYFDIEDVFVLFLLTIVAPASIVIAIGIFSKRFKIKNPFYRGY